MKKIFILTGEPSGDKLAAKVISKLKIKDPSINYLCLGGEELKSLDFTYINPYALLADPVLRSVEKGFRGESPASMAMSFIDGLIFNEYLDDQIFAGALLSLKANRDPQTNKKIWEERDEAEDVFIKGSSFLLKEALEPRTIKAGREVAKMIGTNPVEEIFERIGK